ncbi:uncharacterized protein LOC134761819 isoform X2 [Pongo abelii]|uniref:uncharacterized protein LOC134761819 isoform X2 n=1 Tax=Pongo abelii TaxID=9601 RepID=UPI00300561D7
MAPEENPGTELLLQSFERRFLAGPHCAPSPDCEASCVCEARAVSQVCPVLSLRTHQKARGCLHRAFGRTIRGAGRDPDGQGVHPGPPELFADVLCFPEAIVLLVGVLRRLAACQDHQRAPEVYVTFTVRSPETCQLFITKLGRAGIRWEVESCHYQKLFPYEEHLEMAMLNLTL